MNSNYASIPAHMQEGLREYVENGVPPGRFLRLMLEHRIYEAAGAADLLNLHTIPHYIYFMYNYMPAAIHGSAEAVDMWIASKAKEREQDNGSQG